MHTYTLIYVNLQGISFKLIIPLVRVLCSACMATVLINANQILQV